MIDDNNLYCQDFEKEKRPVRVAEAGRSTCERSVRDTDGESRVTSDWTCKLDNHDVHAFLTRDVETACSI
jgi:hypothetical protein